ncbi:MAG: cytidylate kinase family protein [Candidatus Omnitrophota bacterium]
MSVITLFSASHCHGEEIAKRTAGLMGYDFIGSEILEEASRLFDSPLEKLSRAMHDPPPLLNNVTREKEQNIAYIRSAFAERLKKDNFVYHGFAGHLLPKTLNHILRICIVADREYRIRQAMEADKLTEKQAAQKIEKDDERQCQWTQFLFDIGPWDQKLYDIKIPIHSMSIEEAVQLIEENAQKDTLKTTPASRQAVEDFAIAARVQIALLKKGYEMEVYCDYGAVSILINKFTWRLERLKKKLEGIAAAVSGVQKAEARVGPHFHRSRISSLDFEVPSQVLLVDDEKEFVLTLSERLRMRNIPSQVVYNGEEALSLVKNDEPDVVVLDLMMPGIHGVDVLRQLKKDHPNIEVIILTGHGSAKDEELTRELGAFAYLQKPVDIDKLAQTMKQAYEKIQKRLENEYQRGNESANP